MKLTIARVGFYSLLLLSWELLAGGITTDFVLFNPLLISRPSLIVKDAFKYYSEGLLILDLLTTLQEAFLGLALGIVTGVGIGFLFAYYKIILDIFDPLMVAFNALPRPALAPVLILWFGLGMSSKVFLSWSIVFFVIFYNTYQGIKSINPIILKAVKAMGASKRQILRIVVLPSVFSWIFAALRTSVGYALIGAVVGEFVGATEGLGFRMLYAEGLMLTDRMFAILIIIGMVGVVLVEASKRIENRILKWRPTVSL